MRTSVGDRKTPEPRTSSPTIAVRGPVAVTQVGEGPVQLPFRMPLLNRSVIRRGRPGLTIHFGREPCALLSADAKKRAYLA